jgi:hypothetical protein
MKYMRDDIFLISKKGEDNFVGCLCSIKFLKDSGVKITAKVRETQTVETEPAQTKPKLKKN